MKVFYDRHLFLFRQLSMNVANLFKIHLSGEEMFVEEDNRLTSANKPYIRFHINK